MHNSSPTPHTTADTTTAAARHAALAEARPAGPRLADVARRTAMRSASGRLVLLPSTPHRTA